MGKKRKKKPKGQQRKFWKWMLGFFLISLGIIAVIDLVSWIVGAVTALTGGLVLASNKIGTLITTIKGWFGSDS